ncbi:MAG: O-antigen ligase family protein [Patescibacteria group bacterium]
MSFAFSLTPKKTLSEFESALLTVVIMAGFVIHGIWQGQSLSFYAIFILVSFYSIFKYPKTGIYLIIIGTMWFERHFTLQPLTIGDVSYKIYPLDFILLITGLSLFVRVVDKEIKWKWHKFDTPILLFGLAATFGYLLSWLRNLDPVLAFGTYKNYFLYAVVYVFIALLFKTKEDWKKLMAWFFAGGAGLFFFLFYGIITGHGLWSDFTPLSTYGERLIAGTHIFYMVLFGFFLMSLYFWKSEFQKKISEKIIFACIGLVAIGILVSLVRHLWAALAVIFILWFIFLYREEKKKMITLGKKCFAIGLFFILIYLWVSFSFKGAVPQNLSKGYYAVKERVGIESVARLEDSSFRWRISAWAVGVVLWTRHPVLGSGLGQLVSGYDNIVPFEIAARELHNNYLGILIQLGVVGLGVVLAWFWMLLVKMKEMWKFTQARDNFYTQLTFTWVSVVLLFMIGFSISVYWDVNFFIIWWWVALAAVRFLSDEVKPPLFSTVKF